jgi:hypothetical protein
MMDSVGESGEDADQRHDDYDGTEDDNSRDNLLAALPIQHTPRIFLTLRRVVRRKIAEFRATRK